MPRGDGDGMDGGEGEDGGDEGAAAAGSDAGVDDSPSKGELAV